MQDIETVTWAWPGWIPNGHVTLIVGEHGIGKSWLAIELLRTFIGSKKPFPDGALYNPSKAQSVYPHILVPQNASALWVDGNQTRDDTIARMKLVGINESDVLMPSGPVDLLDNRTQTNIAIFGTPPNKVIVVDGLGLCSQSPESMVGAVEYLNAVAKYTGNPLIAIVTTAKLPHKNHDPLKDVSNALSSFPVVLSVRPRVIPHGPSHLRILSCIKNNFSAQPEDIDFKVGATGVSWSNV